MRINNNDFQRNANTSLVAQLIWKSQGISRVGIARELNLYRSTVTNIISSLIDDDLVYEAEEGASKKSGGRKPIILRLNERFGCVVGLDIQPSHYRSVVLDISGRLLFQHAGTLPLLDFENIIFFLMDQVLKTIQTLGLPLLAVVAGIPGIVDADEGIIRYAQPFDIRNFDFYDFFAQHYDVLAFVENDANCTAWLEMTINRNVSLGDFMCILADYREGHYSFDDRSGIGVGIGLSIKKKVYHGSHYSCGEIRTLSWRGDHLGQTGLSKELLVQSVFDEAAWKAYMEDLFSSLVPVVSVLDPRVVFVHGKPFSDEEKLLLCLQDSCPQFLDVLKKTQCKLLFDTKDEAVVAKGAAMMFLQRLFAVPELSDMEYRTYFDWDDIVAQAYPLKKSYKKIDI